MNVMRSIIAKMLWVLCATSFFILLFSIIAKDIGSRRAQELHYISQHWHDVVRAMQLKISDVSLQMVQDSRFQMSLREGLINTYSSMVKRVLEDKDISHVSIHTSQCGYVYDQYSGVKNENYCRPNVNTFYWLSSPKGRTLLITRHVTQDYLLTVGFEVSEEWIYAQFSNPELLHFSVDMRNSKDTDYHDSTAVVLSYLGVASPVIYDSHPVMQYMPSMVSPWRHHSQSNMYIAFVMCLFSLCILFVRYRSYFLSLTKRLGEYDDIVTNEAQALSMSEGLHNLRSLLDHQKMRLTKLQRINFERSNEVMLLQEHLAKLTKNFTTFGFHKALHREMKRHALPLREMMYRQHSDLLQLQEHAKMIQHSNASGIFALLAVWRQDLDRQGSRKFLRSRLERVVEGNGDDKERSLLASEMHMMFATMEHLRSLLISLHNLASQMQEYGSYFQRLSEDWSGVYGDVDVFHCTLKQTFHHVRAQLSREFSWNIALHMPLWQEPQVFSQLLSSVLRCVFFEVLSEHVRKKIKSHSGSQSRETTYKDTPKKMVFAIHYLTYPKEGVFISDFDYSGDSRVLEHTKNAKDEACEGNGDNEISQSCDDATWGKYSPYSESESLIRRVSSIGKMFSLSMEVIHKDTSVSYSIFWLRQKALKETSYGVASGAKYKEQSENEENSSVSV